MLTKANEGLAEAIVPYRDPKWGMVNLEPNMPGRNSDNGLLFTAEYIALLLPHERMAERITFYYLVRNCEVEPGKYVRYPGAGGNNRWDDHIAVVVAAYLLSLVPLIRDVYEYGERTDWVWNYEHPGEFEGESWLGRYPDFKPLVQVAMGFKLNPLSQLRVAGSYLAGAFVGDVEKGSSDKLLLWLKTYVFEGKYFMIDAAISIFKWRVGGVKRLMTAYFKPHHPFAQFAPEKF